MNKRIIFYCALFFTCTIFTMEKQWPVIFKEYKDLVKSVPLIKKQYEAHINNKVPAPHDERIVAIPIEECGEAIIDIDDLIDLRSHRIRVYMMPNPSYPAEGPNFNSGLPGNSKMRESVGMKLLIMSNELDAIAPQFGYEKGQIDIQVCDALRNKDVEAFLFNMLVQKSMSENPNVPREHIEHEIAKVACPPKPPYYHPSGSSVDIRLWDAISKKFLNTGDFGVPWTKDLSTIPTYAENTTEEQKKNRLLCMLAATKAGLANYPNEFWHLSSGDSMWAYWFEEDPEKRKAIFDLVEQPSLEISVDENGHFKVQEKK